MKKTLSYLWIILILLSLAACSPVTGTLAATVQPSAPPEEQTTTLPAGKSLSPEPQVVTIPSANGIQLEGRYYPGAINPSPLVVLMHWAPGDQHVWDALAPWLQNRDITTRQGDNSWLQSSWFPPLAADHSYAVLTFTFSGCAKSCKSMNEADRKQWLEDAYAAAVFAPTLPGVDPGHIVFVGASIGADGAVDACGKLNAVQPGACRGAFSFSPGSYLTLPYDAAVKLLQDNNPPVPVRCVYARGDTESAKACKAASGAEYQAMEYKGGHHGMQLIAPGDHPNVLQLLLDFFKTLE